MNKVLIGLPMINSVDSEFFRTFYNAQRLQEKEGAAIVDYAKWGNGVNNRNDLVKRFLRGDCTHLFIMDVDNTFPEMALSNLLGRDKDIVGGFYTTKLPPFHSTCFIKNESYVPVNGEEIKEVDIVASGCMLIKRKVLESMKWPWFYLKPDHESETFASEDVGFCEKAKEHGFKIWCDFTVLCGHVGSMIVQPIKDENGIKIGMGAI